MFNRRLALACLASLAITAPAFAADLGQAEDFRGQVSVGLDFGSSAPVRTAYALTLGYRAEAESPIASLLRLDVSDAGAIARLAGVPLASRSFQANAVDGDNWRQDEKPWYARSWVYWTLGGLAATAALSSMGGSSNSDGSHCTGVCNQNGTQSGVTGASTGDGGTQAGCVNGQCAVTCDVPNDPSTCHHLIETDRRVVFESSDRTRPEWLDAGSGWMGDLIAR